MVPVNVEDQRNGPRTDRNIGQQRVQRMAQPPATEQSELNLLLAFGPRRGERGVSSLVVGLA